MEGDAILSAICSFWPTFEDEPADPDQRLIDTGADSLRVMQFVLRLEQALGSQIAYDLLSPEITPRQLAASLGQGRVIPADRPLVFFLAGLQGRSYEMQNYLRACLASEMSVVHVAPPGSGESPALLCDMASTGAWMAASISAMQAEGELRLAGYSMGGFQAFEAARHLVSHGRTVAFLCLFDPIPGRTVWQIVLDSLDVSSQKRLQRLPHVKRYDGLGAFQRRLVDLSLRFGAYRLAHRVAGFGVSAAGFGAELSVLLRMRMLAARKWRPGLLDVTTVLVLTDDGVRFGSARTWRRWIRGLSVLVVARSHATLANAPIPEEVRLAFLSHTGPRPGAPHSYGVDPAN